MITTLAGLEAAPKSVIPLGGITFNGNASAYFIPALSVAIPPTRSMISLVAAGSGGGLLSNGSAGFIPYNATDSCIYSFNCSWANTAFHSVALYDFVWGATGFVGNIGTPQAVTGFPALTRPDANGTGLELFLGVQTASSNTSTLISADYTNSAGVTGRTATLLFGATTNLQNVQRSMPFRLQDGDTGVKSVQSITIATPQAVAGVLCLLLGRRLTSAPLMPTGTRARKHDFFRSGGVQIGASAALQIVSPTGGGTAAMFGELILAHG